MSDDILSVDIVYIEIIFRIGLALICGAVIGYERSYHGRPAGFRTHALVCMASSLLMTVSTYEYLWVDVPSETVRYDPTRIAQGIMTGIGFLGAGVIMKEGMTVRGLTTAASIWMTAAIGIVAGAGLYIPLIASVILTLITLSVFRWIELHMPSYVYYHFHVRFKGDIELTHRSIEDLITSTGFTFFNVSYRSDGKDFSLKYSMLLRTSNRKNAYFLLQSLEDNDDVLDFRLIPVVN